MPLKRFLMKNPFTNLKISHIHSGKTLAVSMKTGDILAIAESVDELRYKLLNIDERYARITLPLFETPINKI